MIFLIIVISCSGYYIEFLYSRISRISDGYNIISSTCSIRIFSHFLLHLHSTGRIDITLSFLDDVISRIYIIVRNIGNFLGYSATKCIISEGDKDFFSCYIVIAIYLDQSILCIIAVFVLSLVVDRISDEIPVLVVEESSLERSGVDYWIFYCSSIRESSGICGYSSIGSSICEDNFARDENTSCIGSSCFYIDECGS